MERLIFTIWVISISTNLGFSQELDLGLQNLLLEKEYNGVIVLYDYKNDIYYTSHKSKADKRVLPASTYKIFNTLMFLDSGIIEDTSHVEKWNGEEYKHKGKKISSWCKDTNLAEAFRNSTVWYYRNLSRFIKFSTYKEVMKKNKYGKVYGGANDGIDFWNEGNEIGVSAKDQIKLLVKLKDYDLTFQRKHIDIVKELMVADQTEQYIFRAKSGWTVDRSSKYKDGRDLGWYIGYVEYKHDSYFFAVRLEKGVNQTKESFSHDRISITKSALTHQFGLQLE